MPSDDRAAVSSEDRATVSSEDRATVSSIDRATTSDSSGGEQRSPPGLAIVPIRTWNTPELIDEEKSEAEPSRERSGDEASVSGGGDASSSWLTLPSKRAKKSRGSGRARKKTDLIPRPDKELVEYFRSDNAAGIYPSWCTEKSIEQTRKAGKIPAEVGVIIPGMSQRPWDCPPGYVCLYESYFRNARLWLPLPFLLVRYCKERGIAISQLTASAILNMVSLMLLGEELNIPVSLRFLEETCGIKKAGSHEQIFYLSAKSKHKLVLQPGGRNIRDWQRFYFFAKIDELTSPCSSSYFLTEWATHYGRHPFAKPFPENYQEDLAKIRRAGTIKWADVAEDRFRKEIDRINKRRPSPGEENLDEEESEEDRDESMPFSSGIPSLVDQLRLEEAAKLSDARPGEETSKKTEEEASRHKQLQQSGAAEEEQLEAAKEEQLEAVRKRKGKEQVDASKEKKQKVDAAKRREKQLVIVKQKAQQREAAKEQLEAAKEPERVSKKRSAEDAAALEAVNAKKAKTASLSHAKEGVPLTENPRLCADLCKGVSSSSERLPEFKEMDEEEVYEEYARSSIQAMTAANELFRRLKRSLSRSKTAQSHEAQMKEVMSNAKTAYRKEQERAKFFEEELAKMRADRDSVVGELEKVKAEFKDAQLQAAHNERTLNDEINVIKDELDLSHEREKNMGVELERRKAEFGQAYKDEQRRLRESREIQVNAERQVNSQLRERCQARFDKIKSHLEKRKESEAVVGLHAQAKGVREVLEYMKSLKTIDVPDSLIADFAGREAKYLARCNAVEEVELLPSDLEVPYGVESTPLEAEAGVVAHRSNEELIDAMVAGELREPTAPGSELADVDAGKE